MALDVWAHLTPQIVHPKIGLINDLIELQVDPGEPDLHFFAAQLPDLAAWLGFSYQERSSGAGRTRSESIGATLGEAIERYASAISIHEAELIWSSFNDLGSCAVDPESFALYDKGQYGPAWPYSKPDRDVPMNWVSGYSLTRQANVLVPAQFVYLPYTARAEEPVLLLHTSTGLACGQTLQQAIVSALCEAIERDAFMIHWLAQLSAPRVDWPTDPILATEMKERYLRPGLDYHVFDITTDIGVPTCLAVVVERESGRNILTVGAATRTDMRVAVEKAIMECVQTRAWLRQMIRTEGPRAFATYDDVHTFEDHVHLWGDPAMHKHLEFLLNSKRTVPVQHPCDAQTPESMISWMVDRLSKRGLEAIVVDVTPEDVRSLGLSVVRVLVPGAIPLAADHRFQPLGGNRLYEVPAHLGYPAPVSTREFNVIPHPFP